MRVFAPRTFLIPLGVALAAGSLLAARPAAAQQHVPGAEENPSFTVRLGGFFSSDSATKHTVGSSFLMGGLDYAIHQEPDVSRSIVSVEYIDRSSGDSDLRIFPVTIGQLVMGAYNGGFQPYYGGGAGAYFVHQDFNTSGNRNSHDSTVFGGYAALGIEYHRYLSLEARYNLVTSVSGVSPSGLEVTAGFRF